ncbi:hypothetical protein SISSUDRAFT_979430 [Sistotremastrum suecicum HHB10207 ss-3]|uniref:Ras modification protein ERF4 n=1 Tax=Sistotremastrum suecicum HHB10207 ss-3 TaxID=1314776 RepID=A0A166HIF0_9AGAM|nr:hypothetical protein SISSUDRAFT_979430 [Sistotremastrum suecicum HHB10207 ss-3]
MSQPQPPRSSYYYGPPADDSAFGTEPMGTIGTHYPREIIRVERDYESGELCQFATAYPLELEGRITPTEFLESINAINEILISAHSTLAAFVDNTVAVLTLYISNLFWTTQYDRSMKRLAGLIDELNAQTFNPRGLNILWPRRVAFLFLEIEYYVRIWLYLMDLSQCSRSFAVILVELNVYLFSRVRIWYNGNNPTNQLVDRMDCSHEEWCGQ